MERAIERAAIAWFDRNQAQRMDAGRLNDAGQPWAWSDLTETDRQGYRALVKPIVEAALSDVLDLCDRWETTNGDAVSITAVRATVPEPWLVTAEQDA